MAPGSAKGIHDDSAAAAAARPRNAARRVGNVGCRAGVTGQLIALRQGLTPARLNLPALAISAASVGWYSQCQCSLLTVRM